MVSSSDEEMVGKMTKNDEDDEDTASISVKRSSTGSHEMGFEKYAVYLYEVIRLKWSVVTVGRCDDCTVWSHTTQYAATRKQAVGILHREILHYVICFDEQ